MRFHFSCTRNPHTEREVYTMRTPRLRLLSAILAVALFFTLLPVSALAEGGGSNANTGLTIGIVGNLNHWVVSHSISMKEVSPAVYEVTIENKSYGDINGSVGFLFVKDNSLDNSWGFGTVSSGELYDAVYGGDYIKIDPGSDAEESTHNFIIRLDLTNWDWGTITGATFTITATAPSRDFTFDATTGTIKKYNGNDAVVNIPSEINGTPVTTIGNAAFRDSSVTSVTIPASVTEIGSNAFAGCTNLTSVNYEGDWSNLTIQSGNPAVQDAANAPLFDFEFIPPDNTAVIVTNYKYNGAAADVTIPSRYQGKPVTTIGHAAFFNSAVTSVTIPDSVTSISDEAFINCPKLTNISIPNSVTYIGFSAFSSCTSLKSITLPSSLSFISGALFLGCSQLTTIHIPVSVTSIGNNAFADCPSLMTVTYPGSKTQWDDITKGRNSDVLENHLICAMLEATFTADGTTFAPAQTIDRGEKFTKPAEPSKENHTFAGWYNGDEKFDFDADTTKAPNVLNLVAKWDINQYTVKFVSNYGSFDDQTIEHGKPIDTAKLTIPPVEGFTFDGWYADENRTIEFDFTKPITGDTKVYAKWTAKDYEVSFITEHGKTPTSQNVKYNGTATNPGELTEDGYTFIGWYTDDTYDTEFDFTQPIKSNTPVYAKWEKNAPVLPDTYALNVSGAFVYVDGVDVTAPAGDTSLKLEKDASVRLVADPDRMPSGMVFDRWTILNGALNADDAEKFETGRTLEEFAFTMPAEPLSIEATPRMQEEESSDTASVIAGVTLGTAATALVAWQAYDLGMSLYQEHWLPADFVMPKTRAELALLLWNTAGRPAPAAQPAFTDITDPDTAQAAQWAVETGLMTPKSAELFKPEKSVTRWKAVRSWKRVTNQNT
jgi:uncharacterized repeat protein (TIGR02543 family)